MLAGIQHSQSTGRGVIQDKKRPGDVIDELDAIFHSQTRILDCLRSGVIARTLVLDRLVGRGSPKFRWCQPAD